MKKIWISIIFLIIAVAVIIGFLFILLAPIKYVDCGTNNLTCMNQNLVSCNPSIGLFVVNETIEYEPETIEQEINGRTFTIEVGPENETINLTANFIVRGMEKKGCRIEIDYIEGGPELVDKIERFFPENFAEEYEGIDDLLFNQFEEYCNVILI